MQKRFELWLDESGDFKDEAEKKKGGWKNPSLIGGILIEKSKAEQVDFANLIPDDEGHATELPLAERAKRVIPVLEAMKEKYRVRQVFFENQAYEDETSNRRLYLRIMAEGLLQLLQTLNAQYESVILEVIIAQRQDPDYKQGDVHRRVNEVEYVSNLRSTMKQKISQKKLAIDSDSELKFDIRPANSERKLQTADYACNTRLLRNNRHFKDYRDHLRELYSDALIYSLTELTTENYVNQLLAQGQISAAIWELYTARENDANKEKMLQRIMDKLQNESYRQVKSQMKQCAADIVAYAAMEDDYRVAAELFEEMQQELIPLMQSKKIPCNQLLFTLLLWLSDNYLREGDTVAARRCIEQCEAVHASFGNALEEVISYYQLIEKKTLLLIDEFDFQTAYDLMHSVRPVFAGLMTYFTKNEMTRERFPDMKSEYFGDALCMELYAGMFLQKEQPDLYDALCEDSDLAMKQYPAYEGELERHRQYRSRIELTCGHYEEAIRYLFLAKEYDAGSIDRRTMREFMDRLCDTEATISCQYYLMYYVLIMAESMAGGRADLAEDMYLALQEQKRLLRYGYLIVSEEREMEKINIAEAAGDDSGEDFHPVEIILWKYGSYLVQIDKNDEALKLFDRALKICRQNDHYITLRLTGLGIEAEKLACLLKMEKSDSLVRTIIRTFVKLQTETTTLKAFSETPSNSFLSKQKEVGLQPQTISFIEKFEALIKKAQTEKEERAAETLMEAARMVAY